MPNLTLFSNTDLITPSNNLVFALYDASTPMAPAFETIAPAKPYGVPLQIMFTTNLTVGHVYTWKVWESAGTTPTGQVRNSGDVTINGYNVAVRTERYLVEGVTAGLVAGTTSYDDTSLVGWDWWMDRVDFVMQPQGATDVVDPDYSKKTTGGWDLLKGGDQIQPGEKFTIHFNPQVILAPPPGTPSGVFGDGVEVTTTTVLDSSYLNKAILIKAAATVITVTLPPLSSVPDYSFVYLFSNGGNHINASIPATSGDKILYSTLQDSVVLGQVETMILYKAFGVWNVMGDLSGVSQVGTMVYNYDKLALNTVFMAGQLLSRAEYPRLWAYVSGLATNVTDTAWGSTTVVVDGITYYTKKGCYSTGDGSTTFRVPDLRNAFVCGVDGTVRLASSWELQSIQTHDHVMHGKGGITPAGGGGLRWLSRLVGGRYSGAGGDGFGGNTSIDTTLRTGDTGSTETKPTNTGVYISVRI